MNYIQYFKLFEIISYKEIKMDYLNYRSVLTCKDPTDPKMKRFSS